MMHPDPLKLDLDEFDPDEVTTVTTGEAIDARARVVAIARGELGYQDPRDYYADCAPAYLKLPPNAKAWCGVFALWCLRRAGLTTAQWEDRKGFLGELGLRVTALPEPGDVAVFGAPLWHYAIVEHCKDGKVHTIDGNTMQAPAEGVTAKVRPITPNVTFYSIGKLIGE
jgi:hypothetical protein